MAKHSPDWLIYEWAKAHDYHWCEFYPQWDDIDTEGAIIKYRNGRPYNSLAGYWCNEEIAEVCTHGISFYDGVSRGTQDMIDRVNDHGSPCDVYLFSIEPDEDENGQES